MELPMGRPTDLTQAALAHIWGDQRSKASFWGMWRAVGSKLTKAGPNPNNCDDKAKFSDFAGFFKLIQESHQENSERPMTYLIGLPTYPFGTAFCKPIARAKMEPKILYHHPVLDKKFGLGEDYHWMKWRGKSVNWLWLCSRSTFPKKAGFHL